MSATAVDLLIKSLRKLPPLAANELPSIVKIEEHFARAHKRIVIVVFEIPFTIAKDLTSYEIGNDTIHKLAILDILLHFYGAKNPCLTLIFNAHSYNNEGEHVPDDRLSFKSLGKYKQWMTYLLIF